MEKIKVTKKNVLTAIAIATQDIDPITVENVTVTKEDILNYIEKTIAQLDSKNAKAKERAAKIKAEGDDLTNAIKATLTEDAKTINEIIAAMDIENVTPAKVSARISKLVKEGAAERFEIKTPEGRKLKAYALVVTE